MTNAPDDNRPSPASSDHPAADPDRSASGNILRRTWGRIQRSILEPVEQRQQELTKTLDVQTAAISELQVALSADRSRFSAQLNSAEKIASRAAAAIADLEAAVNADRSSVSARLNSVEESASNAVAAIGVVADQAEEFRAAQSPLHEAVGRMKALATDDPLWAILSDPAKRDGGWKLTEFLQTGRDEALNLFTLLDQLNIYPKPEQALDFGCGVGRVTHALTIRFREVHGIDVSRAMIEKARVLHVNQSNLQFHHDLSGSLPFHDKSFDLVYSRLVLQHMPSEVAIPYIAEFVRVLSATGVAVFQAPSKCLIDQEIGPSEVALRSGTAQIEMHAHSRDAVEEAVQQSGGEVVHCFDDPCAGEDFESLKYVVRRVCRR